MVIGLHLTAVILKTQIQYKLGLKVAVLTDSIAKPSLKTQIQYKLGLKVRQDCAH